MKRLLQFHRIAVFIFLLAGAYQNHAQTTISTNLVGGTTTTSGGVTFAVQNTNSSPIQLTDVGYYLSTADNGQVYTLYYSSTSLSGAQPTVWPDPNWTLVGSQTVSGVTTTGIQNVLTNQTLVIPPNTTFRFSLLKAGSIPLYTSSGGNTFSAGGVNLFIGNYQISGANVGYAYTLTPRYWCGSVTFAPFGPCTSPPTPGVAVASNATPCLGQTVNLNLTGASLGSGQTYQWESSTSLSGPWVPEGTSSSSAMITATPPVGTTYYRCMVTCGSSSVPSVADTVTVPTPYPGGTYTINSAVATGGTNFQTFSAAVAAISCGISGPIVFNVAPGSGPYNEQINLPATIGADATNTVTFNGNGRTITQTLTGTPTNYATINIDGADHITFNDLNIGALGATYGFGVHLMNGADHNTFKRCNVSASTTATGTTTACISMSGSATSYSTTGVNGSNNSFDSCTLTGGYFGFVGYGSGNASTMDSNNHLTNSLVKEFYVYGAYHYFNRSCSVSKSVFERPTRANASTGYGVYLSSCINMLVEKNKVRSLFGGALTTTSTSYPIFVAGDGTAGNENKVINNAIYSIEGNGIIGGIYLSGADYVQVYHNTISLDYTGATAGTTYGIYSSGTVGGVDIKNNNISVTRGGSGLKYGLYFINSIHTSNNNNIYVKAPNGFLGYFNADIPSLAAWQALNASNPWDMNSVTNDPVFANPATGNYAPLNAMVNDLGTYVNVNDDINGVIRNTTTPDMGAYEFLPPACSGAPVAGTASADKSNACINGLVTLSVTGFSTGSGIAIQWEEEVAPNVWSAIPNATNSLHTATFTLPTRYRAAVSCNAGTPVYSNVLTVGQNPNYLCYCSPNTGTPIHSTTANYITSVTIPGTTLNVTTSAVGIGGYTQHNPSVAANTATLTEAVTYFLNAGIASATYGTEMWIDWDQSGTFDASEYTLLTPGTTATAAINVPLGVTPGMTGLRLRSYLTTAFGASGACANASTGRETEDFVITIVPNTNCAGTPSTAGTATVDRDTVCVTGDVKLKLSGYPLTLGIDKNWQSSPAGANTFTDIPGANMDTFTAVGVNSGTDFRARVTCTSPGGGTTYSNIKTVIVNNPTLISNIPGSRCGTGSVALYAQAANGGIVNWYANPTGGSVLATGNVFVTPSISTTTSYYAAPGSGGATTQTSAMPPTLPNVSTTTNAGLLIDI
ncbi:MAG TPA: GEVED domain-containing protein, partial [Flavipsychrobacter sp.]|nr:GEVED domain-containing protein [Flavipsychrobacter sp.]